ncbi:class I SAM-dependent methyltransferase [Paenibacillus sp. SC116]|uniref:class I SAM-dependent methyltransferase n=1 Tax=Paenibacillus sp. SC116 TaxID=2968986 RepID=UPI00215A1587|nr:class I SAM-dependent methyltransferase [Paenibacillus sp. SC116]MCR8842938.1 class I SAM-dependent methyltransferase [Paenibacillus sp. SC116]
MDHNLQEYADVIRYDEENKGTYELATILKMCQLSEGPVLDAATGTGRIAIPLAQEGYEVVGVDLHQGMLDHAALKSAELNLDIVWQQADCEELPWENNFQLVSMVGNAFQHFLTNDSQSRLLQSFHKALKPGGICLFDTRFPLADEIFQPDELLVDHKYTCADGRVCEVAYQSSYDAVSQIQRYKTVRTYYVNDQIDNDDTTYIDLRYTFPQELIRLMDASGFELLHMWGGWKEQPLTGKSISIVVAARKR